MLGTLKSSEPSLNRSSAVQGLGVGTFVETSKWSYFYEKMVRKQSEVSVYGYKESDDKQRRNYCPASSVSYL